MVFSVCRPAGDARSPCKAWERLDFPCHLVRDVSKFRFDLSPGCALPWELHLSAGLCALSPKVRLCTVLNYLMSSPLRRVSWIWGRVYCSE